MNKQSDEKNDDEERKSIKSNSSFGSHEQKKSLRDSLKKKVKKVIPEDCLFVNLGGQEAMNTLFNLVNQKLADEKKEFFDKLQSVHESYRLTNLVQELL